MRRIIAMLVAGYMSLAFLVPMAHAISITARAKGDIAVVSGKGFESGADIQWEGGDFGVVNSKGRFKFEDPLPTDCIGELIVGSLTADITVERCTPSAPPPPVGAPAPVPQTGQTTCWDPDDTTTGDGIDTIACAGTGEDGDLLAGEPFPVPRFTVNNPDGTVTDNLTGLIWLRNANCEGAKDWAQALSFANNLAVPFCGLSDGSVAGDWRLPNVRELHSLIHFGFSNPALSNAAGTAQQSDGDAFETVQNSKYWSSTSFESFPVNAWFVDFIDGFATGDTKTNSNLFVLPVRGP